MPSASRFGRLALCVLIAAAASCGGDDAAEGGAAREPLAFTGSVEAVDTVAGTVTVRNDDVPGWMSPMSMTYRLDPPEPLRSLEPGDQVRATVYTGDFTTLYGVEVVTP
ncbi:MAG: copper-binding protein [Gemmatimonadales bacterium]